MVFLVTLILASEQDIEPFLYQISVTSIIRILLLRPSTDPCASLQHSSESLKTLTINNFQNIIFFVLVLGMITEK